MIFLASPYTHRLAWVRQQRAQNVSDVAARLIAKGYCIFCPIAYCHYIALGHTLPHDAKFWEEFNRPFLDASKELWVVTLDGWQESVGVQGEVLYMSRRAKPLWTIESDTLERRPLSL